MSPVTAVVSSPSTARPSWQSGALQAIFAMFLGIMIAFLVGVGVTTFHPNPADETRDQLMVLYQQQDATRMTDANPAVQQQIVALEQVAQAQEQEWAATTGVIVIVCATVLLAAAVGLATVESAWVFSTGLLLGGIFTMLFGVAVSMMSGQSLTRFFALIAALVVVGGLGYIRFVRVGKAVAAPPTAVPTGAIAATDLSDVDRRLDAVEDTIAAMRAALRG